MKKEALLAFNDLQDPAERTVGPETGEKPRILSVDYGRRRIGLALSDPLGITAQGMPTLDVTGKRDAVEQVAAIVRSHVVAEVVIGLPLNMNGSRGPMSQAAAAFGEAVGDATGVPVVCWDERLTTEAARKAAKETGGRSGGRHRRQKGYLDRMAATMMLEDYLRWRAGKADESA